MHINVEIPETVKGIVKLEWKLLCQAAELDGADSMRTDQDTFTILRSSEIMAWSTEMQESYYFDIVQAHRDGHNPLRQKYAYILEQSAPDRFAELHDQLPKRSREEEDRIDRLCALRVAWREALSAQYPRFAAHVFRLVEDIPLETRLRGEMAACTANTLRLYASYAERLYQDGENLEEMILRNAAAQYGYASPAQAEEKLGE